MAAQHASASPRLRRQSRPVRVAAERYTVRDVVAVALIIVAVVVLAAVTWVTGGPVSYTHLTLPTTPYV